MKKSKLLFAALLAVGLFPAQAVVKPSGIFSDKMVLQRGSPLPVWGTAGAGEEVKVSLLNEAGKELDSATTKAGSDGSWKVQLKPIKTGPKYALVIKGGNEVKFSDVLAGEVWFCSGQSNMHWTFDKSQQVKDNDAELQKANYPEIRFFNVPKIQAKAPAKDVVGKWMEVTPANMLVGGGNGMSALGYFFGRELQSQLKVPIGLINSSVGGTAIELWSPNGGLYNSMVAPVAPYPIRGALWYQGESNVKDGAAYTEKMKLMIEDWRKIWGSNLAFGFVQLAPFTYGSVVELPKIWEAQVHALSIPNTGMAVITDTVDNLKDIHPKDKQTVAKRLSLWALAKVYDKRVSEFSSPLFKSHVVKGEKVVLSFTHANGLKTSDGKEPTWFTIAGDDKKFVPATAVVRGDKVEVFSAEVKSPTAVRFGWHENAQPNLVNSALLPASPFRTDSW